MKIFIAITLLLIPSIAQAYLGQGVNGFDSGPPKNYGVSQPSYQQNYSAQYIQKIQAEQARQREEELRLLQEQQYQREQQRQRMKSSYRK